MATVKRALHDEGESPGNQQARRSRPARAVEAPGHPGRPASQPGDDDIHGYIGECAAPIPAPTWKRRVYIERSVDVAALARDLAGARMLAIDAEFMQMRVRTPDGPSHRLSLVQFAADDSGVSYVVDALRLPDLSVLAEPLENTAILKIFHGISADARMLATRGLVARHTLDLEAASRSIFGQRESSLQAMLLRACGVRLDKSLQRADWSRRPLTSAMVAYAAHDAEMTLTLHTWLSTHYRWALDLHETHGDAIQPTIAAWIVPYLDGARPRPAALAVEEAGLATRPDVQAADLRQALGAVRHPTQRARIMRLITDLELARMAPDLRPYLTASASEERSSAARALGRLRDVPSESALRALLDDPVQDVRQAARLALENLRSAPATPRAARSQSGSTVRWTSSGSQADGSGESGWQDALRASFGIVPKPSGGTSNND